MELPEDLAGLLLPWYRANRRDLPWRRDKDPYRVWLSEIMLQQTRVEAVKGYYARFLEVLPDIRALADCPEDKLMKLWEGLGYYSRARNLQRAARVIVSDHAGTFPREPEQVLALPGIGEYTAGAVCSICFDLPIPAVDGNVLRVCARVAASRADIALPETKEEVRKALLSRFPEKDRGDFNQALMELGATVCIPKGEPLCGACPLSGVCRSRGTALRRELPVRSPKKPRQREDMTVFLLRCGERAALRKRPKTGLLAGLWEFPSLPGRLGPQEALDRAEEWGCEPLSLLEVRNREHIFTHREWRMRGYVISCAAMPEAFHWACPEELDTVYSLPSAFRKLIQEESNHQYTERSIAMKTKIESKSAPAAIGPYSQAILAGDTAYVSGMLGIDPATGSLLEGVEAQAEQGLKNLEAVLKEAGMSTDNVVKTTVFLTDMGAFAAVNAIYAEHFSAPFPARSCVQVSALPKGGLFEIEAIAVR